MRALTFVMAAMLCCVWLSACASGVPTERALADVQPDPAIGREVFVDRNRGHCLLCHAVSSLDAPFHGTLGPPLDGVGARLSAAELRLRLVDPTRLNPETSMPPYYRTAGLHRVGAQWRGQPLLSAADIEHLIAWLQTLRSQP